MDYSHETTLELGDDRRVRYQNIVNRLQKLLEAERSKVKEAKAMLSAGNTEVNELRTYLLEGIQYIKNCIKEYKRSSYKNRDQSEVNEYQRQEYILINLYELAFSSRVSRVNI